MVPINLSWTEFKDFVSQYSLTMDYAPEGINYFLHSSNGSTSLSAYITDPTEVLEFETFFKPSASEVSIPPSGGGPGTLVNQGSFPWVCSIGAVALPTGASTSALQTAGNATLTSIDGKTPAVGQALMAASSPVVIASDQSAIPAAQSGVWSIAAVQSGVWTVGVSGTIAAIQSGVWSINSVQSGLWTVGISGIVPVSQSGVWTVDAVQSGLWTVAVSGTVAVSAAALPLPGGAATEATLATLNAEATQLLVKAKTDNLDIALSTRSTEATLATRATEATLATRASEATLATRLTEATFTTRHPVVGQAVMAASMPVTIASDQTTLLTNIAVSFAHFSTPGTTVIKASPGIFHRFIVNDFGAGTFTFYDNTAGSGAVIAVIKPAGNTGSLIYELRFSIGLTVVITGATPGDATVTYD